MPSWACTWALNTRPTPTRAPGRPLSLARRASVAAVWSVLEQLGRRGTTLVTTTVLALYLEPSDYGLLAMTAVFLAVAGTIMESGMKDALLRKEEVSEVDLSTAFLANLGLGALCYVVLYGTAPWIAAFYEEPRLIDVIRVIALSVPLQSLEAIQVVRASRDLNFRRLTATQLPASMLAGVLAIVAAASGMGVWALVAQRITQIGLSSALLWYKARWLPRLEFSRESFGELFAFGRSMFLSGILNRIFENAFVIVIAKVLEATAAGQRRSAQRVRDIVLRQLVSAIERVAYPSLAKLQSDPDKLREGYRFSMGVTMAGVAPVLVFTGTFANRLFDVVLSPDWQPAALILQVLCVGGMMYPLQAMSVNGIKVVGRSDLVLKLTVIKRLVLVTCLAASLPFGLVGLAAGQSLNSVINYIPNSYYSSRLLKYPVSMQLTDVAPAVSSACLAGAAGWIVASPFSTHDVVGLALGVTVAGLGYLAARTSLRFSNSVAAASIVKRRRKADPAEEDRQ